MCLMTAPLVAMPKDSPPLDPALEQERSWIAAWQQNADRDALSQLIASILPRIRAVARRCSREQDEDLTTEGVLAVIESLQRYHPQGDIPFFAYAAPAVRGAIFRAFAAQSQSVSIPERHLRDAASGRMAAAKAAVIAQSLQSEPYDPQLCQQTSPTTEDLALGRERQAQLRAAVAKALSRLERTERHLIVRHILNEDVALETLAQRLHLPLARARMIEGRALHKMRNALMNNGFGMSDLV